MTLEAWGGKRLAKTAVWRRTPMRSHTGPASLRLRPSPEPGGLGTRNRRECRQHCMTPSDPPVTLEMRLQRHEHDISEDSLDGDSTHVLVPALEPATPRPRLQ